MRKITSLLMLLCAFVGTAFAQTLPATDKSFTLITDTRGGLAANDGGTACVGFNNVAVSTEEQKNFAFVQYDGNVYLYNVWAKKFMMKDGSLSTTLPIDNIQITNLDNGKYFFKFDDEHVVNLGGSSQLTIDSWGGTWGRVDEGNSFTLTGIEDFDPAEAIAILDNSYTITYEIQYNGKTVATQTTKITQGANYPAINNLPYGVTANVPEGAPTQNETVVVSCTYTLPFVPAEDYASITNWYYLKFHSNSGYYLYYNNSDSEVLNANKTAIDASNRDAYTWAFVGNPFDGFKVVNKLAGSSMAINSVESGAVVSAGSNNVMKLTASSHGTNGFFMQATTGNYKDRFNVQNNKVVYWSGADAGSTFQVEERDMSGRTELEALVATIEGSTYPTGTTIGYLTQESVDALMTTVSAANTALEGTLTAAEIAAHEVAINNAIATLVTIQPEEGKFYVIKSATPESDGRSGKKIYVNDNGGMQFEDATTMAHVFQFVDAGDNTFYMKSVERGTYLSTNKAHNGGQQQALATETADAKAVAIANMGRDNVVSLIPVGGAMIHAQAANSVVVAWNKTENTSASAWVIEEIDIATVSHAVTISDEAGWASLVLGYNATIPAGVKAYAVTAIGTGYATLSEVTGAIPAGEAVLLEGAGTHEFTLAETATAIEGNKLEGTLFNSNIAKAAWILGLNEGVVGLYTVTLDQEESTAFTNNAFKAYLPKTSTEGALRLEIGTTGIENAIVGENGNAIIFDLSGRRVSKMQKGIYIVNGKKVLVK